MTKIIADAEEKYVKTVIVHAKKSDSYVYADAGFNKKISKDELLNLCKKGLMISYGGVYYTPVCFKEETSGYASVTIYDVKLSTAAAVTFYSGEYTNS